MEVFIIIALSAGLFVSGISLGAYLENKRLHSIHIVRELYESIKETQQIILPLADKITHLEARQEQFLNYTIVDYANKKDLGTTMEFPAHEYESITEELNIKEEEWLRKQKHQAGTTSTIRISLLR